MECLETKLPESIEAGVKRMLAQGRSPLDISAIFRATPERAKFATGARMYAESFSSVQITLLRDALLEEQVDQADKRTQMMERRRLAEQVAAERVKARSEESSEHTPDDKVSNPKSRKTFYGLPVTSLIRLLSSLRWDKGQIGEALKTLTGEELHPATLHIQWTKGQKGQGIPEVSEDQAADWEKFLKENREKH